MRATECHVISERITRMKSFAFFLEGNHRSPKSLQVKCGKYKCIHVNDDCCATECAITLCKIFSFRKKSIFGEYWFSFSISWKTISVRKTEVKTKSGVPVPFTGWIWKFLLENQMARAIPVWEASETNGLWYEAIQFFHSLIPFSRFGYTIKFRKWAPGLFQRRFFRGLYSEGLIYGEEIGVSKSIGLAL